MKTILLAIALVLGASAFGEARALTESVRRVAIVIDQADPQKMQTALSIAINRARMYAASGETADVRIVAHGDGLRLLREDTTPDLRRLKFAAQSFASISFLACLTSQRLAARSEGRAPTILSFAESVPNAVVTVETLEEEGWPIIRL